MLMIWAEMQSGIVPSLRGLSPSSHTPVCAAHTGELASSLLAISQGDSSTLREPGAGVDSVAECLTSTQEVPTEHQ